MSRIVVIGEAMVEELVGTGDRRSGYGGDTLNTAIHLARLGHDVAFVTAVGSDAESQALKMAWAGEGIDTSHVMAHPDRTVGRYYIAVDTKGERTFTYDRDRSAARDMFALPAMDHALKCAETADLVIYSLITLAILPPAARERLFRLKVRLAFDGNYRPRLWASAQEAAAVRDIAIGLAAIGLPTLEDEASILGKDTTPDAIASHWGSLGCEEVVVKLGASGARLPGGVISAPQSVLEPIDTSGAGDAFNAGFISHRLRGASLTKAAEEGHRIAGWTIMRPGAIPPLSI